MVMQRFFLTSGFVLLLSTAALAEKPAPLIGGEDLPSEVITQFVAGGPLVALPVSNATQVANTINSGLKDCGKDVGDECTATIGGISGQ